MSPTPRGPVVAASARPRPTSMIARGPGMAPPGTRKVAPVSAAAHPPKPPATFPKPASVTGPSPVPGQGSKAGSAVAVAVTQPSVPKKESLEETNKGHARQVLALEREIEDWKARVCPARV
jgi:hypothetical protein